MTMNWDAKSGCRERLMLLSVIGPDLQPEQWDYFPHSDAWHFFGLSCGKLPKTLQIPQNPRIPVRYEASEALKQIAQRYNLTRPEALQLVGYPE